MIHDAELNGAVEHHIYKTAKIADDSTIKHFQDESGRDNDWDSPTIKHFQEP